jgi:protease-4
MAKKKDQKMSGFMKFIIVIAVLYLLFNVISFCFNMIDTEDKEDKFAIIRISGTISYSEPDGFFSTDTSTQKTIDFIKSANRSRYIKGIILEIDSPGGTVLASKELAAVVKGIDKPNTALIRQVGASGAYWAASSSDYIIADELSIVGSIGVYGSYLSYYGIMDDYNITYERLVGGEFKDTGTPYKNMTEEERAKLQGTIDKLHDYFIEDVAQNRNMPEENMRQLATGETFLGLEAIDNGLIDELGNKEDALDYLEAETNITDYQVVEYKEDLSLLERLARAEIFYSIGLGIGDSMKPSLTDTTPEIGLY